MASPVINNNSPVNPPRSPIPPLIPFADTELYKAIDAKNEALALDLISQGVCLTVTGTVKMKGRTYLIYAAFQGLTQVCDALLKKGLKASDQCDIPVSPTHSLHIDALACALINGHLETADLLLKHNVDVNLKVGGKPLLILFMNTPEVAKWLIKNNADIHATDDLYKRTALDHAASDGHLELCQLILEKKPEVNHFDVKGFTPLILAVLSCNAEVVDLLLNNGADPTLSSIFTKVNALHCAASKGNQKICGLLLDKGLNVNSADIYKLTPLHHAAASRNENTIDFLLNKGANPHSMSSAGITPLYLLKSTLIPWPSDRYQGLVKKDNGLTDHLIELRMLGHRFTLYGDCFTGTSLELAFHAVAQSLEKYKKIHSDSLFDELPNNLREASLNNENVEYFLKRIANKKLTILPTHWSGHATLVIIWDDLICKFNRGENAGPITGLKIGRIKNVNNIPRAVNQLMRTDQFQNGDHNPLMRKDEILEKIKADKMKAFDELEKDLDVEILDIIPYKKSANTQQIGQNCAYLAAKIAFKGPLYLREYRTCLKPDPIKIRETVKKTYSPWLTSDFADGLESLKKLQQSPFATQNFVDYQKIYAELFDKLFKFKRAQALTVLFTHCPQFLKLKNSSDESLIQRREARDNIEFTRFLLNAGVDPNNIDYMKVTRLTREVERNQDCNLDMVRLLCEYHADVNLTREGNFTNLQIAITNEDIPLISLLLENGANAVDEIVGFTPLSLAKEMKNEKIVEILNAHIAKQAMKP